MNLVFCCILGIRQSSWLTGEKRLFSSILMKLRSCNKAQCSPRHEHHWTTSQQVGHRQHKWHAILALLATGTVNKLELCSSSGCHDLHMLSDHEHWWLQLCKSGQNLGAQVAVSLQLWHPILSSLTSLSLAKCMSGISPAIFRKLVGTWLALLSLSLW